MPEKYNIDRFKNAQKSGLQGSGMGTYEQALQEIRNGRKMGHWMWYIFPQPRGFGHSRNTWYYGISCLEEARAYLEDEVLGTRLREISKTVLNQPTQDVRHLMGSIDSLKLSACMTLFDYISPNDIFEEVINKFYAGSRHFQVLQMIHTKTIFR